MINLNNLEIVSKVFNKHATTHDPLVYIDYFKHVICVECNDLEPYKLVKGNHNLNDLREIEEHGWRWRYGRWEHPIEIQELAGE